MTSLPEISLSLISEEEIRQKLTSVFVESIILTNKFDIDLISNDVLEALGYTLEEVQGKSITFLNYKENLQNLLLSNLNRGFFEEVTATLKGRHNKSVSYSISGFYLGLVSDINGYIILKVKNLDRVKQQSSHDSRHEELDNFIYRAAHDLRGPLASIRGLVGVMKLRKDNSEVDAMLEMLDSCASHLDEQLFKLLYLAESHEAEIPSGDLKLGILEILLRDTLTQNCLSEKVNFHFTSDQVEIGGVHEHLVQSLLNNTMLYIISLPRNDGATIHYHVSRNDSGLFIEIRSTGFTIGCKLRQALQQKTTLYSELLISPNLINYYAARKIAQALQAQMRICFPHDDVQEFHMQIPFRADFSAGSERSV
jgi:signal transduction histidine kinase